MFDCGFASGLFVAMIEPLKHLTNSYMEEQKVDIPGNTEWIGELIPDLAARLDPFIVNTDELDDELIEVFIEEIERLTGELQAGLAQSDGEMLRMAAHSIKGMGGTMGLPEISVLGLEIENRTKAGRWAETRPLIDGLARWMETLRQEH